MFAFSLLRSIDAKAEDKEIKIVSSEAPSKTGKVIEKVIHPSDEPEAQTAPDMKVTPESVGDLSKVRKSSVEKSAEKQAVADISETVVERTEPCFVLNLQDEQVTEGDCVKLKAKATGIPKPEFVWFKDEKRLNFNDRVKTYEESGVIVLEISKTELEDEGDYICIAKNDAGEVESFAELLIDGKHLMNSM